MKLVWTVVFLLVSPLSVGIAYADSGMFADARDAWSRGLEVDPSSKEIAANLKKLSLMMAKASSLDARLKVISELLEKNDYDRAIEECKRALEIDPKSVAVHNNLGVLYGMTGKDDEAIAEFKDVVSLSPNEAGAYKNIAIIYSRHPESSKDAIEYFEKYLTFNPPAEERALIEKKLEELKKR